MISFSVDIPISDSIPIRASDSLRCVSAVQPFLALGLRFSFDRNLLVVRIATAVVSIILSLVSVVPSTNLSAGFAVCTNVLAATAAPMGSYCSR